MNKDLRAQLMDELADSRQVDAVLAVIAGWVHEMSIFYPDPEQVEVLQGLAEYVWQKVPQQQ